MNCYKEQLPEGCPPDTAKYITETQEFFRLVVTNPPTDDDFRSQRSENPSQNSIMSLSAKLVGSLFLPKNSIYRGY